MKKKAALGLAGIAAAAVIGGTWAYWSQDLTATNEFETGKFDSNIIEDFTPPAVGEWLPGVTVDKKVKVTNDGDVDLVVAASVSQVWTSEEGTDPVLMFTGDSGEEYAARINWGADVIAFDRMPWISEPLGIETSVNGFEDADAKGKWILVSADTPEEGDGYTNLRFVYNGVVEAGENAETPLLIESVTLNEDIEAGVVSKTYGYDEEAGEVVLKATESNAQGYSYENALYTMTINANTVQATKDAVTDALEGEWLHESLMESFLKANNITDTVVK